MLIRPNIEEITTNIGVNTIVPISMELFSDIRTPIQVLRALKKRSDRCYLLESVEGGERWGRYSFLGLQPKKVIRCCDFVIEIEDFEKQKSETIRVTENPVCFLRRIMSEYKSMTLDYLPPFTGGLVGYISYDFIRYTEPSMKLDPANAPGFDDFNLMLFDKVIVFDHLKQKMILIVNIDIRQLEESYPRGVIELQKMADMITGETADNHFESELLGEFKPLFSKNEYGQKVQSIKHYIREGDIFQAVLSNRLEASFRGDLLAAYRVLRTLNPSPYMFYMSMGDIQVAGASPETLIQLKGQTLATFPIAGTCPRGATAEEEEQLIRELITDEKELSEHTMLVDLGRNDLGKISEFDSVQVTEYQKVIKFSHVCHIASSVTGTIQKGKDQFDAISAVLPAGTLSGAPKRRACEIINEMEGHKRGIYGGAIGYFDFSGNADFCIAIRMIVKKDSKVYIQSGAGIVADSDPQREYEECINKAKAMIQAMELSGEVTR